MSYLDVQNQINSNMMNLINASRQNSTSGNNYNQAASNNNSGSSPFSAYTNMAASIAKIFM